MDDNAKATPSICSIGFSSLFKIEDAEIRRLEVSRSLRVNGMDFSPENYTHIADYLILKQKCEALQQTVDALTNDYFYEHFVEWVNIK